MKIVEINNNKYIDQELYDYINSIWNNYDQEVENDKNIFFLKNTTIYRLITDYCNKGIKRVTKKEKADYLILQHFGLSEFNVFYDGTTITENDNDEVLYPIYNNKLEDVLTIEQILEFKSLNPDIKFVNQSRLNDSLNNGFVVDITNYTTIKELLDSQSSDNHKIAVNMMVNSSLKDNYQWILYLFHEKYNIIKTYDTRGVISNYYASTRLNLYHLLSSIDSSLSAITDNDVRDAFVHMVRDRFKSSVREFLKNTVLTDKFILKDFKLDLNV